MIMYHLSFAEQSCSSG